LREAHEESLSAYHSALLIFALASYVLSNPRKPSTVVFALGGIESCDSDGNTVDEFNPGDPVYVKGSGLELGGLYNIYIVQRLFVMERF
jgi:hypothetical protein